MAAEVAIKQLGTNGGGFFGPNSAHPFENPSPWSNLLEVISIIIIPMASIVMFGLHDQGSGACGGDLRRDAGSCSWRAWRWRFMPSSSRARPRPACPSRQGGNLEGKEVRLGPVPSATWSAITTATSNGSVNSMHDSFQPLGGLVPMSLMMLNVDFSGIGAGFLNMLMYVIVAVFLAGLMVGRTPEYLGKKIEAREVKLAMIVVLIHPLLITCGTALFAATDWGKKTTANPGPHGFSEVLYEFTSAAANNGSGFEGLSDNNPAWNIATGVVLLLGRFPALVLPIAIAGFLAEKKRAPTTSGTLLTNDLTFAAMLLGTVLLVGALSFMPAVVLGPIADHLSTGATARCDRAGTSCAVRRMAPLAVTAHGVCLLPWNNCDDFARSHSASGSAADRRPGLEAAPPPYAPAQALRAGAGEDGDDSIVPDARPAEHGEKPGHVPGGSRVGADDDGHGRVDRDRGEPGADRLPGGAGRSCCS